MILRNTSLFLNGIYCNPIINENMISNMCHGFFSSIFFVFMFNGIFFLDVCSFSQLYIETFKIIIFIYFMIDINYFLISSV